jgi:hypothetical protein
MEIRTYLAVTREENSLVKKLGAKFDVDFRRWYINQFDDSSLFRDWIVGNPKGHETGNTDDRFITCNMPSGYKPMEHGRIGATLPEGWIRYNAVGFDECMYAATNGKVRIGRLVDPDYDVSHITTYECSGNHLLLI